MRAATSATFALNPGESLDMVSRTLQSRGAGVVAGLAPHSATLDEHTKTFADRLLAAVGA